MREARSVQNDEEHECRASEFVSPVVGWGRRAQAIGSCEEVGDEQRGEGHVEEERQAAQRDQVEQKGCLLYTSPSPRDLSTSRMPSSA